MMILYPVMISSFDASKRRELGIRNFMMLFYYSTCFLPIAYYHIFSNHNTTTPNELNRVFGFIDDDGRMDSTAGSPLSPPRVTHSKLSIIMSNLKVNLYLCALAVAIVNPYSLSLFERVGLHFPLFQYVAAGLYILGYFSYTSRVYNYQTNILLAVAIVFTVLSLAFSDVYYFGCLVIAVEICSYYFLRHGGESTAEVTSDSTEAPSIFTTMTGTGSDLEAQDMTMSKGGGVSGEATPVK